MRLARLPLGLRARAALAVLAVLLAALTCGYSTIGYRAELTYWQRNVPQECTQSTCTDGSTTIAWRFPVLDGEGIVQLLIYPEGARAPIPPGLDALPQPGHFLVSQDLVDEVPSLETRYGTYDGTIGEAGQSTVYTHTMVYRPRSAPRDGFAIAAFGQSAPVGEAGPFSRNLFPEDVALVSLALGVLAPALLLAVSAFTTVRAHHARRFAIYETLGAPPAALRRSAMRGLAAPFAVATALALALVAASAVTNIPVPGASFVLRAYDVRQSWYIALAALALGVVLCALTTLLVTSPRSLGRTTRPAPRQDSRWVTIRALIGAAAMVALSQAAYRDAASAYSQSTADRSSLWLVLAVLLSPVAIPAVCAVLLRGCGALCVAGGHRLHLAPSILLGRSLIRARGARHIAGMSAMAIFLATIATAWTMTGQIDASHLQREIDAVAGSYVEVTADQVPTEQVRQVMGALPAGMSFLVVHEELGAPADDDDEAAHDANQDANQDANESVTLMGTADDLSRWSVPATGASPSSIGSVMRYAVGDLGDAPLDVAALPSRTALVDGLTVDDATSNRYIVFTTSGDPVDRDTVQGVLTELGGPDWQVGYHGEDRISGARLSVHSLRWATWGATIGAALLLGGLWVRLRADQDAFAARFAPIDAMFSRRPRNAWISFVRGVVVSLVGAAVGLGCSLLFTLMADLQLNVTGGAAPAAYRLCRTMLALGVVLVATSTRYVAHLTARWRPGGHDGSR